MASELPPSQSALSAARKHAPPSPSAAGSDSDRYAGLGLGVTGLLAENLAWHPFLVLRRQCQVNIAAYHSHTTPITLLPVMVSLHRWQGVGSLWKGLGSALTVKGESTNWSIFPFFLSFSHDSTHVSRLSYRLC